MRLVAFLRAINVGGHIVKMDRLRQLFEELGLTNVETFIASGNVIFDSRASAATLEGRIERHLENALGYAVTTFIRPVSTLSAVMTSHPFATEEATSYAMYVGFLKATPDAEHLAKLSALESREDTFHIHDRELYWLCRTRLSDSAITNARLERALGGPATLRNITSLRKLAKKVGVTA
jgi:uncharacterized protein (DUF1697 family)